MKAACECAPQVSSGKLEDYWRVAAAEVPSLKQEYLNAFGRLAPSETPTPFQLPCGCCCKPVCKGRAAHAHISALTRSLP